MSFISIIENTFFANARYWGGLNSSLYHSGSIWGMKTGIQSADLNMVWNEKPLALGDGNAVQDIKKYFQKAGLPFWWWVFPGAQSQTTFNLLKSADFSLVHRIPSMLADLTLLPDEQPCDSAISIRGVKNRKELHLWEEVSFAGFDFLPETKNPYHEFVSTFNLSLNSPQKFFLACFNGKPAATSLLFLHEGMAGIYFVSTLSEYRKKGIGLAITLATMRAARQIGARFSTLQSSPEGFRVYQQAGFTERCRVDVYSRKG